MLPSALLWVLTSTGSSLFTTEQIPDLPPPGPIATPAPERDAEPEGFQPKLRSKLELDARLGADLRWERRGEQVGTLTLAGRLELDAELGHHVEAFVAPHFTELVGLDQDGNDRELLLLEVPEAQVSYHKGPFRIRAGALIFAWGSSDLIGPSDVLNPMDLRSGMVASPDELKIPVLAAEGVLTLGALTLRGVIEPTFTASRFFVTGWDSSVALLAASQGLVLPNLDVLLGAPTIDRIGDQIFIDHRPSDRLDQGTIAARATLRLGQLDLSGTAVRGWDTFPALSINPALVALSGKVLDALATGVPLDVFDPAVGAGLDALRRAASDRRTLFYGEYRRKTVLGIDATWALDPFVLKLDAAYTPSRVLYTQAFQPVDHPWLDVVIGAEYSSGETWQLILEAFAFVTTGIRSYERLMLLEERKPPPSTVETGVTRSLAFPGLSSILRYSALSGDLTLELALVASLPRGDLLAFPTVRYRLDDHQALRLGAVLMSGPSDTYAGLYRSNNEVFLGYRWSL